MLLSILFIDTALAPFKALHASNAVLTRTCCPQALAVHIRMKLLTMPGDENFVPDHALRTASGVWPRSLAALRPHKLTSQDTYDYRAAHID